MDLLAHPLAERRVDELVLAHSGNTLERLADDHGLPMVAVAAHLEVVATDPRGDQDWMDSDVTMGFPVDLFTRGDRNRVVFAGSA